MDCYKLLIKRSAEKELRKVHPTAIKRIVQSIQSLAKEPLPSNAQLLKGADNLMRLRVGDYRILYEVDEQAQTVMVYKIGHRREVYK